MIRRHAWLVIILAAWFVSQSETVGLTLRVRGSSYAEREVYDPPKPEATDKDKEPEPDLHPKSPEPVPREKLEASIKRGIEFLLKDQNKDGSWGSAERTKDLNIYAPVPGAHHAFRTAVTAMCVSALTETEDHSEAVKKAIERGESYLFEELPKVRRGSTDAIYNVWTHAYGIQALVDMHKRLPKDKERQKKIEELIRGQYDRLTRYETTEGGWGYYDIGAQTQRPNADSTSFVDATVLNAFNDAKQIGVDPPEKVTKRAIESLKSQRKPDFTYLYGTYLKYRPMMGINRPGGSLGRSQACNLALRLWGDKKVTEGVLKTWLDRLITRNGWLDMGRKRPIPHESHFQVAGYFYYYGHYYAALCIEQLKPEERAFYQDHLAHIMMNRQEKDGSWWDYPLYNYHQQYGTAFGLMTLKRCEKASVEPASPSTKSYEPVVKALNAFVACEVEQKSLPALSIALVDDQKIIWSKGFGFADPKTKKPATADTVYRVGSVSKLFTDIAVMQQVERGALDLDAPITKYLPDFKPVNKFDKPITLRQLMTHRSGLVREPPIGHYFDDTAPSLEKTVASLNMTELVYEPEKKTKYSNAAIGTVGFVLQSIKEEAFPRYLHKAVLDPLGMAHSSFEPLPEITKDLAASLMWTYHGREFPAPTFELGEGPAGSMYSTVNDLGKFMRVLFAEGKGAHGQILKKESLDEMWKPQFAKEGDKNGFGLGFMIGELDGKRTFGHGGAIYGFSTELEALPDEKLGVVVIAARDGVNAVTTHIAQVALRQMLAAKQGKDLPKIEETKPLKLEEPRKWAGRYRAGDKYLDLVELGGTLALLPGRGGFLTQVRALGDSLIVDDRLDHGLKIEPKDGKLVWGTSKYERKPVAKPEPAPAKWAGLIGEYGWDYNTLYIFEKDGRLHALIEWFYFYPLTEESENVFAFPDFGLYHGEKLIFTRDKSGRATQCEAAQVVFKRRQLDGENGETFTIKPIRPLDELKKEALAAKPPVESGEFHKSDLVDLTTLDNTIKLDIRYATKNNFLSTPFYSSAKAFMQRPAAEAVARVHKKLADQGYGLLIHDGYRPWYVTKMFWDATPEKQHMFVADPAKGSRHNRGCAVDLTLYDLKTGKPIEMVGGYDEMSDRSYPGYWGGTSLQRWHRDLLRHAMEEAGFTVYEAEWWHFDYKDWKQYKIGTATFEEIAAGK